MTSPSPVIVVGSGPSGVSVALALLEGGVDVHMIDAGDEPSSVPALDRPTLAELRTGAPGAAEHLLGSDLSGLRDMREYSPKLRTAAEPGTVSEYTRRNRIEAENFRLVGGLSRGGLSNIWGAVASVFDAEDLADSPISYDDLLPSYRVIAERIGISGSQDDDMTAFHGVDLPLQPPLELSPTAQLLWDNYQHRKPDPGFRLGHSRNAVLSEDHRGRGACSLDMMCMWGCRRRAIYSAADDVAELLKKPGFTLQSNVVIDKIVRKDGQYLVIGTDTAGAQLRISASRVILAAGTLASSRLVLDHLDRLDAQIPLLTCPSMAMALWMPGRLGDPLAERGYGMAQLSFSMDLANPENASVLGQLYTAEALAVPDLVAHSPFTRPGSIKLMRGLMSGLLLGFVYFPGKFSQNRLWLTRQPDGKTTLRVKGGYAETFPAAVRSVRKKLARQFRRAGAWWLPGSTKVYEPGAEVHYGGSLPMGSATTTSGEVIGAEGLYVVDGSILNTMPAKHHTVTMMANADRIGRILAKRLRK
ncbi:MAG: GMC family oxidoreductase [Rhodospirillales bacterium]|nr:GMC family oxidoreductase [Rhodospirillales bacterium]